MNNLHEGSPKAAIIDDDRVYAEFLGLKLQGFGFDSEAFSSADEFYDILYEKPQAFQLILVDRFIGPFDALIQDFALSCKKVGYSGKILLISAVEQDQKFAAKKGFDMALKKSASIDFKKVLNG